jgi:hypothetical protein
VQEELPSFGGWRKLFGDENVSTQRDDQAMAAEPLVSATSRDGSESSGKIALFRFDDVDGFSYPAHRLLFSQPAENDDYDLIATIKS